METSSEASSQSSHSNKGPGGTIVPPGPELYKYVKVSDMKVALIGLGRWGKVLLGELEKQAELKYKCDSKTDLGPVLSDSEITAVFIATPTNTHFDIALKALEAGKHVFLEKPGTDSSEKLGKLIKLAEAKKLKFAVGYEFPHHPGIKKIKELINGKGIRSIHFDWQKWGTFKDDAVLHLLCHDVSVLKFLGFDDLAFGLHHRQGVISDTDITWTCFKSSRAEFIESNIDRVSPIKQKALTIITRDGGYILSNNDLFEIVGMELKKIALTEETPVSTEIKDFLMAIEEGKKPLSSGQFALEIYRILETIS